MTQTHDVRAPRGIPPKRRTSLIPLLLVLAGVLVLLYPVVATQYNNIKQRDFAARYSQDVQSTPADALAAAREEASAYNATLSGVPILDPYLSGVTEGDTSDAYTQYTQTLSSFDAMARVRVPSVGIDLPVYHGTSDDVIGKGAGHLYGTSLPVGGTGTHAVLTSHTGMSNATLFDNLIDVREGDLMYVDVYGETLAYEVDTIKVVLPTEIDDLRVVEGADLLTLFTCTPYAVNSHRLLVTGHRVPWVDTGAASQGISLLEGLRVESWMITLVTVSIMALAVAGVIAVRERRRRMRRGDHEG